MFMTTWVLANAMSEHLLELGSMVISSVNDLSSLSGSPLSNEPRFNQDYIKLLTIDCYQKLHTFLQNRLSPLPNESMAEFGERISNLQLARQYLKTQDLPALAAMFNIATTEIQDRLNRV